MDANLTDARHIMYIAQKYKHIICILQNISNTTQIISRNLF
jgi:hypothetical protein